MDRYALQEYVLTLAPAPAAEDARNREEASREGASREGASREGASREGASRDERGSGKLGQASAAGGPDSLSTSPAVVAVLAFLWDEIPLPLQALSWESANVSWNEAGATLDLEGGRVLFAFAAEGGKEQATQPPSEPGQGLGRSYEAPARPSLAEFESLLLQTRGLWVCAVNEEGEIIRQQGFAFG